MRAKIGIKAISAIVAVMFIASAMAVAPAVRSQGDETPPVVNIYMPQDGATYYLNDVVLANWTVLDDESGIADYSATAPNGSSINTSAVGTFRFYAEAENGEGLYTLAEVYYNVVEPPEEPETPDEPAPVTYREPEPSPAQVASRDNASTILSLLNGTSSVNATGYEELDYNNDGTINIADAFDQMSEAGLLWTPAFKFEPGAASAFLGVLEGIYGPSLENMNPIDGRVWMLYVLTYLPYT